jgi:hypothetical protein
MTKKIKTRKGKDGKYYPYTSPDLVIDDTGKVILLNLMKLIHNLKILKANR